MDTNEYEYDYEYELPSYSQRLNYKRTVEDPLIDALRSGDFGVEAINPHHDDFEVEPHTITIYPGVLTNALGHSYYNGEAKGPGGNYILDAFPNTGAYKSSMPGGATKSLVLHTLDEIRTTGVIEQLPHLTLAAPGKVQKREHKEVKLTSRNTSFIWIPGESKIQHQIWWFVGTSVTQLKCLKYPNKISWSKL